ncbi:hypothetical protein KRX57_08285 [Weeksellaceae bacterium TAE3-ERU29]|nr:hypothetical protein [Weeksellaceae bacterium TAE3-ERU29]
MIKKSDEVYYFGGYYLIKLEKCDFGSFKGKKLHTCSYCLNTTLLDSWSFGWLKENGEVNKDNPVNFNEDLTTQVHNWVNQKFNEEKIGWFNVFSDLETLKEYKQKFFPEIKAEIMSVNFPESEKNEFLKLFEPENSKLGEIGLFQNIKKNKIENKNEETIGYDLIGIELGGGFHSFHCHDLAEDLINKFGIEINEFGLIKENDCWREMLEFMNDKENNFEYSPWFYVKVNKVKE